MRKTMAVLTYLTATACASGPNVAPIKASTPLPTSSIPAPSQSSVGTNPSGSVANVIGQRAASLTQRFGNARIDLVEGDARKLQFAGQSCVLDIFLYPPSAGSEPVATHIETRLRQGGGPIDHSQCIREIARAN